MLNFRDRDLACWFLIFIKEGKKKEKDKTKEAKETSDWGLEIAGKLEQTSRPQELRDLFPSG